MRACKRARARQPNGMAGNCGDNETESAAAGVRIILHLNNLLAVRAGAVEGDGFSPVCAVFFPLLLFPSLRFSTSSTLRVCVCVCAGAGATFILYVKRASVCALIRVTFSVFRFPYFQSINVSPSSSGGSGCRSYIRTHTHTI